MVGRHLVVALPAAGDPHVEQRGASAVGDLHDVLEPRGIRRGIEARRLVTVGHPEEEARALAVEVEAGREVDRERDPVGQSWRRTGEADLAEVRLDRQLDSDEPCDLGRPDAGGAYDRPCVDAAERRLDATDIAAGDVDPVERAAGDDRRSVRPGGGRVSLRDRLRARVAVERREGRGEHAVEPCERAQRRRLVERDEPARHAELVLQGDTRFERRDVLAPVEEKEVADLVEVDLGPRTLAEAGERLDAPQPDRDVERVRELGSESACRPAGRAARELPALEEADVDSGLGEVERDARPDDAASDDHDVGCVRKRGHRRTRFLRKNPRFAGRSASRRMR